MKTGIWWCQKLFANCQLTSVRLILNQINIQMSKNFRNKLQQWVISLYGEDRKPKKGPNPVGRRPANFESREPKNTSQEKMVNELFERLEQLRDGERNITDAMQVVGTFLQSQKLAMDRKQEQQIFSLIQKYLAKTEESAYNCRQEVINVWDSHLKTYDCVCPKTSKDLRFSEQKSECYRCSRQCHVHCLWSREREETYECPMCFLRNCIPNKQVKKVLFAGFLRQIKKDKIEYKINLPLEIADIDSFVFQARCVRLCRDNRYEITWPINCSVFLNSKKIADFKPLNNNSSIKKRVDDQIVLDKRFLARENSIVIEEKHQYQEGFRPTVYQNHFIVICQVQVQSVQEMVSQMMETRMPVAESKQILREYLDRGMHDCFIQQLKIKLKCQFYNGKITVPVRSKHCTSHYQPFDLKGFILANINIRSSTQRWKCPICRQRAYHLVVDDYLLDFITTHKDLTEIQFNNKGDYKMVQQEQSDNQSEKKAEEEKYAPDCEIISCQLQEQGNQYISRENGASRVSKERDYTEYIQIQSEDGEGQPTQRPKRTMEDRGQFEEIVSSSVPQKRRKQTSTQNQPNPLSFLRLKKATNLKDSDQLSSSSEMNAESRYSPDNSPSFRPDKKDKRQRKYRKDRVFEEQVRTDLDKMSKILVPTPAISTVIPQAIRILDKKLPDISKKNAIQIPVIDIESQSEQTEESRRALKMKYHMQQLQKEQNSLTPRTQKCDITAQDELLFLSLCQKFMTTSIKGY